MRPFEPTRSRRLRYVAAAVPDEIITNASTAAATKSADFMDPPRGKTKGAGGIKGFLPPRTTQRKITCETQTLLT